jgi:predicted lipoprotein with Yx(FWY)xxD motif
MDTQRISKIFLCQALCVLAYAQAYAASPKEDFLLEPTPPGFQVVINEIEGPVYANKQGRTLYVWPKRNLRAGVVGEDLGKPTCGNEVVRISNGGQSPYPAGYELPEIEKRPSCTAVWPPVFADDDSKPIGKWTVLVRPDGRRQWAYEKRALYTSVLDKKPGDAVGGTDLPGIGEGGAERKPVAPPSNVPGQFDVQTTMAGRLVTSYEGWSIYTYDGDSKKKSNCHGECLIEWTPVLAPSSATRVGEWEAFERTPGVKQWAFRGRPVYEHRADLKLGSLDGADFPGWKNVYTQLAPAPPKGFVFKPTIVGTALGDSKGMTVYRYVCSDDGVDGLSCDTPESPQLYRFVVCGGGDPERCVKTFPYIIAPAGAKTDNDTWGTMYIDPKTGKPTKAEAPGALNVWTFRERPLFTFAGYKGYGDHKPTEIKANGWGEGNAGHNGYMAVIYRDISDGRDGAAGGSRGR